eukprot:9534813-Heterocapsa_arctica.AAC.1
MGCINTEITGKRPGYLSPSTGLNFAGVPNGLAVISKVPAAKFAAEMASDRLAMMAIIGKLPGY